MPALADWYKQTYLGTPEEADKEGGGAGGGGTGDGGVGLVVQVLRFTGGAGEGGETHVYLSDFQFACLNKYEEH